MQEQAERVLHVCMHVDMCVSAQGYEHVCMHMYVCVQGNHKSTGKCLTRELPSSCTLGVIQLIAPKRLLKS